MSNEMVPPDAKSEVADDATVLRAPQAAGAAGNAAQEGQERPLWTGRTAWRHYIGRILIWLIASIVWSVVCWMGFTQTPALWLAATGLVVLLLLFLGPVAFAILGHRYRLTTERLIIEKGILSQTIDQTELIRVDDVRIHKTLMNRLLRLGTVAVISTDVSDRETEIPGIAQPEVLADSIRSRMRALRKKSLYVEQI